MVKEGAPERKEMPGKFRVVFLIGRGSRLPSILDKILIPNSGISVPLVASHRKPEENHENVPGIDYAKKLGIPAVYWNWVQMQIADQKAFGDLDKQAHRQTYMRFLGEFIAQQYYRPNLVFMTGWDLVVDEKFTKSLKDTTILNVHPHPLPESKADTIEAPDGAIVPVLRGTEVWVRAVEQRLPWSGVTVHRIVPGQFDVGHVVAREWVKVDPGDTADSLREKLNKVEDEIVPDTILKIAAENLKVS